MRHICVDLETLGVSPEAVILAIGAVEFDVDEQGAHFGRTFYTNVSIQSCLDEGLKIDESTVMWWLQQDDAARASLTNPDNVKTTLGKALDDFNDFFTNTCGAKWIWARGQDFDIGILRTAYARCRLPHAWKYNDARDTRTLYEAVSFDQDSLQENPLAHNALEDAKWEAYAIGQAMRQQVKMRYDLSLYERKAEGREDPADEILRHLQTNIPLVVPDRIEFPDRPLMDRKTRIFNHVSQAELKALHTIPDKASRDRIIENLNRMTPDQRDRADAVLSRIDEITASRIASGRDATLTEDELKELLDLGGIEDLVPPLHGTDHP